METNLTQQEQEELARTNYKKFLELAEYWNKTDTIYYSLYIAPLIEKYKNSADAGLSSANRSRLAVIFAVAGFVLVSGIAGVVFILHDKTGTSIDSSGDSTKASSLEVLYAVKGRATSTVGITMQNESGGTTQINNVTLPWKRNINVKRGAYLFILARSDKQGGSLTVQIYINRKLFKESSSTDAYGTATVSGIAK